ncbi:MAG: phospholipid carrier-dependent glycosyltransferase [Candidatus Omnitrophota bacterium]
MDAMTAPAVSVCRRRLPWKGLATALILTGILLYAFYLRHNTFWLAHWKGDQNNYIALAMKLDYQGIDGYTLREVMMGAKTFPGNPPIDLMVTKPAPRGEEGDMVRVLRMAGLDYFDQPLHIRAPLLPYLLMYSHRIFASKNPLYTVCATNLGKRVKDTKPLFIMIAQFWVCIVPLFFNLSVILLSFWMGARLFNRRVGLMAAAIITTNSVSLLLGHLVLVEDVTVFFIIIACMLYHEFFQKKWWGVFAAGIAAGLAIMAKQTAGILLAGLWVYSLLRCHRDGMNWRQWIRAAVRSDYLIFLAAVGLVTAPWFYKVWHIYGNPLYVGDAGAMSRAGVQDITGWFGAMRKRPPTVIFFSLGVVTICPVFAAAFFSIKRLKTEASDLWHKRSDASTPLTMLWLWILSFFMTAAQPMQLLSSGQNQEHRYFYMAYPAIAVVSALMLDRFRCLLSRICPIKWVADLLVLMILGLSACVGVPLGMRHVLTQNFLL